MPVMFSLDSLSNILRTVMLAQDPVSFDVAPVGQTGGRLHVLSNQWATTVALDDSFALPGGPAATFGAWMNPPVGTYATAAFVQNTGAVNITGFQVEHSTLAGGAGLVSNSGTQALLTVPAQVHYLPSPFNFNADLGDWYLQVTYGAFRYGFISGAATSVRVVYLAQGLG